MNNNDEFIWFENIYRIYKLYVALSVLLYITKYLGTCFIFVSVCPAYIDINGQTHVFYQNTVVLGEIVIN